jgi:hypothetical protein
MEYIKEKNEIILDRELNNLDKFVIDFCSLLDNYVVVSGYVSILFGRSRATEDVDLLIPVMSEEDFERLWKKIYDNGFECINTDDFNEAFEMFHEHNIRFARKGIPVPNMEFKQVKKWEDEYSINNKIKVDLGHQDLFISPLEMQIAYKLGLSRQGNKKDLEDAKHIYNLFFDNLNKEELDRLIIKLNVKKEFELIKKDYGTKYK